MINFTKELPQNTTVIQLGTYGAVLKKSSNDKDFSLESPFESWAGFIIFSLGFKLISLEPFLLTSVTYFRV